MPHLAPLYWTLSPLLILTLMYMIGITTYFNHPTGFSDLKINFTKTINWKW